MSVRWLSLAFAMAGLEHQRVEAIVVYGRKARWPDARGESPKNPSRSSSSWLSYMVNTPQFARADPGDMSEHQKTLSFCGTKCTCPWSWLSSCNAQLSYLCVECYNNNNIINIINIIVIIIIISIIITIIFKSSSQLNVKFNGGGNLYSYL